MPISITVQAVAVLWNLIESHVLRVASAADLRLVEVINCSGIKLTASVSGNYRHRERHAAKDYSSSECQLAKHHNLHVNAAGSVDWPP
jgi:hypothetical protein